ncbi:DUF2382 domain-containing protein (plasmid) [Frigoribacterium sp. NBH87]|uniref:PRC and DUF2382 domain-containing protein n=1 Tax=Frigoribacterium sp. NBH87 TaxID=2596916 RepID=UPI0016292950|nr:PRC and DUF2382 domain-containing protein [Frigoribacterium sp. NBH87]QNE45414.1 DUF2382 domain-containing protein [Frigoribacterium sp. NBH87]
MIDSNSISGLFGARVTDRNGDKVGTVQQVYVDQAGGHAQFVTVNTGFFGTSESFVPVEDATFVGEDLTVSYDKATVKDAPRIDADGALSEDEEARLYSHYGLGGGTSSTTGDRDVDTTAGAGYVDTDRTDDVSTTASAGHDTSGPDTDDAMTRSEEQLHVGTETTQAGRARLRKYVVTEQETVTVPVSHDEVRLEREPITDANVGDALDGPALSEEEHEVVLNQERVVVDKEAVPVERVKLGTETVTEQQQVTEDVSHEEIELDEDGTARDTTTRP